jgi:glycosyltransferase involved in cell wall biosynthesis
MRVCFLLPGLSPSGGVGAVVKHAESLAASGCCEVTLMLRNGAGSARALRPGDGVRVVDFDSRDRVEAFDVAVATWWETVYDVFAIDARRHAYFIQSLEDRFYGVRTALRGAAYQTRYAPLAFITEASWIADHLAAIRPESECHLVRNGIDKAVFSPVEEVTPNTSGPLRVLVEGAPEVWFKGVRDSLAVIGRATEPIEATLVCSEPKCTGDFAGVGTVVGPLSQSELADVYARTDVLVKHSRVEGMYGPPLEAFHKGATCLTTAVTGHDEYVRHGWNGVVCQWDDVDGAARQLDLLARNRPYLHFLRRNALATAKSWPSWDHSGDAMALALNRIAAADDEFTARDFGAWASASREALDALDSYHGALGLTGDLPPHDAVIEDLRNQLAGVRGHYWRRAARKVRSRLNRA